MSVLSLEPPGIGQLYKCALCKELVYESQLDQHVLLCPDPSDKRLSRATATASDASAPASPPASPPTAAAASSAAPLASASLASQRGVQPTQQALTEASASSRSLVPVATSTLAASSSQQRTSSMRKQQVADEMRRKEDEECTFHPKTLPRGSPRVPLASARGPHGVDSEPQRLEQRMKSQRLRRVEAEAYADVTLMPKISRFAEVWSQRQNEMLASERIAAPSVFERLYTTALRSRLKAAEARELRAAELEGRTPGLAAAEAPEADAPGMAPLLPSAAGSSPKLAARRATSTAELLYSDALDRRERLRALTLRACEEGAPEPWQVLGRSRRIYWQMLERQLKAAFEACSGGERSLPAEALEVFLIRFGCLRPPRQPIVQEDEVERQRLSSALLRHLDPGKVGQVDIEAVTVFFLVLLGAMEEVKVGQASSGTAPAATPEASSSPGSPAFSLTTLRSPSCPEMVQVVAAPAAAAAAAESEAKYMDELLVRFDPAKVRTEFKTFYTQRMYVQSHQAMSVTERQAPNEDLDYTPGISARSRELAERAVERQKLESGQVLTTHADVLLWRHRRVEAKKEEMRQKALQDEVSGCTFRPKTKPSRDDVAQANPTPTPRSASHRTEALYNRAVTDRERRDAQAVVGTQSRSEAEVAACTFKPNTTKSGRSYHRAQEGAEYAPAPRGFYETRRRLREAGEADRRMREQRDNRLARAAPTRSCKNEGLAFAPVLLGAIAGDGKEAVADVTVPTAAPTACASPRGGAPLPTVEDGTLQDRRGVGGALVGRQRAGRESRGLLPQRRVGPGYGARGDAPSSPGEVASFNEADVAGALSAGVDELQLASRAPPSPRPRPSSAYLLGVASASPSPSPSPRRRPAEEEDIFEAPPLMFVDVNVAPGQPLERIVLRQGQSVSEVAAAFAAKHVLSPAMAKRLHDMLGEVLQRQNVLQQSPIL